MSFQKGQSGNPKGKQPGTRNKITQSGETAARKLVEDPAYLRVVKARLLLGESPHMEALLWQLAYGKPRQAVDIGSQQDHPLRVVVEWDETQT